MTNTAEEYEGLLNIYWPIGVAFLVVIWLAILYMAIRYRRRRGDDSWPEQKHERKLPEVSYIVVLALISATLVFFTFTTMDEFVADLPAESTSIEGQTDAGPSETPAARLKIDVVASRWNWRFTYPEFGITQAGTGTQIPTLVVPLGNVRFSATSVDVIHSFYIPEARFKRDAFPGRRNNFTLGFRRPGYYAAEGVCAEYCGLRHAYMEFNVRVLEPQEFQRWARERRDGRPQELTPMLNEQGRHE